MTLMMTYDSNMMPDSMNTASIPSIMHYNAIKVALMEKNKLYLVLWTRL